MTAQERPAGRMARRARPAGARPILDPRLIRRALEHSDRHPHRAAAARFGVSPRAVSRWRARRAEAAARGQVWPSEDDVAYWDAQQPSRASKRAGDNARIARAAAGGPLMVDATGTVRRLRALACLGWPPESVSAVAGVSRFRLTALLHRGSVQVQRTTADRVRAAFDELSMSLGPSARMRATASAARWAPPLAWEHLAIDDPTARPRRSAGRRALDDVAVQRAMRGEPVQLRPVERAEAVRRLTARGLSAAEIAERLNTTPRSVTRNRSTDTTRRSA